MLYSLHHIIDLKIDIFFVLKVGHISEGFKMADKKRYLSDFPGLRDEQWPYEFG